MSPAELRAAAGRLAAAASELPGLLRPVEAAAGPDVWRGPAAKVFDEQLRANKAELRRAAAELEEEAARLRRAAEALEESQRKEND